jgi:hypothetical protein
MANNIGLLAPPDRLCTKQKTKRSLPGLKVEAAPSRPVLNGLQRVYYTIKRSRSSISHSLVIRGRVRFLIPLMIIPNSFFCAPLQNMNQVAGQEIIKGEIWRKTANQVALSTSLLPILLPYWNFLHERTLLN